MNPRDQQIFDAIAKKQPESLTQGEIDLLKARASYLTPAQEEKFDSILKGEAPKEEKTEVTLKELKVRGEAVGLTYKVGTKKTDFEKLVIEAESK